MAHLHVSFLVPTELQSYHSEPRLWRELGEWMTQALTIKSYKTVGDMERSKQLVDLKQLPDEIEWLQREVVPKDTTICFCHNDVLATNIMYSEETKDIQLIDFEYGGMNFAAFDIANHFNEFAGGTDHGTPNYEWFPALEFQRQFIKSYLQAWKHYQQQQQEEQEEVKAKQTTVVVSEEEIDHLHAQVRAFVLVDHLYWGLWGVNQAATEGTHGGFDYLLYGSHRINEYYRQKTMMMGH